MNTWRAKHGTDRIDPVVESVIKELKEKYGVKKIGTVGYCFGAKSVVRFLKKGVTDAGYVAHPSFVTSDELKEIEGPLSISAAGKVDQNSQYTGADEDCVETDGIFPAEKRHESEKILIETKQPYQINLYSGVSHGFAVRADLSNKVAKYAKEQAFLQAIFWFDEHLKT
jgi:dienelactone hydrolase